MTKRYACPCCGYLVYTIPADGSFDICPVCFWEDDGVQREYPEYAGGANKLSLNQARENFIQFGAVDEAAKEFVRPPLNFENPERHDQV